MTRSLRELSRPRPIAYWSQGAHDGWSGLWSRRRGAPTPDEFRAQAWHGLSNRITSLYWFNLSQKSLPKFPGLIDPITRVSGCCIGLWLDGFSALHAGFALIEAVGCVFCLAGCYHPIPATTRVRRRFAMCWNRSTRKRYLTTYIFAGVVSVSARDDRSSVVPQGLIRA